MALPAEKPASLTGLLRLSTPALVSDLLAQARTILGPDRPRDIFAQRYIQLMRSQLSAALRMDQDLLRALRKNPSPCKSMQEYRAAEVSALGLLADIFGDWRNKDKAAQRVAEATELIELCRDERGLLLLRRLYASPWYVAASEKSARSLLSLETLALLESPERAQVFSLEEVSLSSPDRATAALTLLRANCDGLFEHLPGNCTLFGSLLTGALTAPPRVHQLSAAKLGLGLGIMFSGSVFQPSPADQALWYNLRLRDTLQAKAWPKLTPEQQAVRGEALFQDQDREYCIKGCMRRRHSLFLLVESQEVAQQLGQKLLGEGWVVQKQEHCLLASKSRLLEIYWQEGRLPPASMLYFGRELALRISDKKMEFELSAYAAVAIRRRVLTRPEPAWEDPEALEDLRQAGYRPRLVAGMNKARAAWFKKTEGCNPYVPVLRANWVDITQLPQQWELWRELALAQARADLLEEEDSSDQDNEPEEEDE